MERLNPKNTPEILIAICLALLILIGCTESPSKDSLTTERNKYESWASFYYLEDQVVEGMTYRIWYRSAVTSDGGACIAVVNITKDKLEVEKLLREANESK